MKEENKEIEGKEGFCTIVTANFFHYALTLHDSLVKHHKSNFHFSVYISQGQIDKNFLDTIRNRKNFHIYNFDDLQSLSQIKVLKDKYSQSYHDAFRWGMKPIFLIFLLKIYDKIIYLDSDLYFFYNSSFIFEELENCQILLTPHWRNINPQIDEHNFSLNFTEGNFNAGFVAVAKGAETALDWWAEMILFKCEVNRTDGFYVDQRYLDLLPIYFDKVKILKHKGCNIANWNIMECRRTEDENGEILINNEFPIIFIHFTNSMFTGIYYHDDDLLLPFLEKYRDNLLKYSSVDIIEQYFEKGRFKKPRSENDFIVNEKTSRIERSIKLIKRIYRKLK